VEDFAAASPSDLTALLTLVLAEAKETDNLIPDRYVPLLAAAKGVRKAFILAFFGFRAQVPITMVSSHAQETWHDAL
jgi:hypothetical protein